MNATPATPTERVHSFTELGVDERIAAALARKSITEPFPIQELTLPLALSGADVIGQARTGTGKTLAFGIPLLQHLDLTKKSVQALVIVPTRELCLQVHDDLALAGADLGVRTVAVYGGKAIETQTDKLTAGAQIVVGTPGRLLDLMRRGALELGGVSGLVLDEADEMLDMGFLPDVETLIEACRRERQTLLFSATMPSEVIGLARRYMNKPTFMRADVEEPRIGPDTTQHFLACHRMDKPAVLARILQAPGRGLCVVFTRTKRMADVLVDELADHGVEAAAIHSNLRQEARERTLSRFRQGKVDVLCATEVAARGLDISDVTHVVNYDCPDDERMYLHRIGRTGRAGADGVAVTLVLWNEMARLEMIKKALEIDLPTHEVFSTSPLLDELFELPPAERREPRQGSGRSGSDRSGSGRSGSGRSGSGSQSRADAGQRRQSGRSERTGRERRPPRDRPSQGGERTRRGGRAGSGARPAAGSQAPETADTTRDRAEDRSGQARTARRGEAPQTPVPGTAAPQGSQAGDGGDEAPRRRARRRVDAPTIAAHAYPEVGEAAAPAEKPAGAGTPGDPAVAGTAEDQSRAQDGSDRQRARRRRRTRGSGTAGTGRHTPGVTQAQTGATHPQTGATQPQSTAAQPHTEEQDQASRAAARESGDGRADAPADTAPTAESTAEAPTTAAAGQGAPQPRPRRQRRDRKPGQRRRGTRPQGQQRGGDAGGPGGPGGRQAADRSSEAVTERATRQTVRRRPGTAPSAAPQTPVLTTAAARGEGKPALRRPLRIAFLP